MTFRGAPAAGQPGPSVGSHAFALTIGALALLAGLGGDAARMALRYERGAIAGGEFWRLVTGHLAHLGWSHLLLNLAGLALVWALVGPAWRVWQWLLIGVASVAAMDAALLLLHPDLGWYVGLSGLLHGLLAAGALPLALAGQKDIWVLLALLAGKLLWEQLHGALPMTAELSGGPVIVDAHLYGALGGVVAAVAILLLQRLWRARARGL